MRPSTLGGCTSCLQRHPKWHPSPQDSPAAVASSIPAAICRGRVYFGLAVSRWGVSSSPPAAAPGKQALRATLIASQQDLQAGPPPHTGGIMTRCVGELAGTARAAWTHSRRRHCSPRGQSPACPRRTGSSAHGWRSCTGGGGAQEGWGDARGVVKLDRGSEGTGGGKGSGLRALWWCHPCAAGAGSPGGGQGVRGVCCVATRTAAAGRLRGACRGVEPSTHLCARQRPHSQSPGRQLGAPRPPPPPPPPAQGSGSAAPREAALCERWAGPNRESIPLPSRPQDFQSEPRSSTLQVRKQ